MTKILFVITEDWALISHRLHLVSAAVSNGYDVAVATKFSSYQNLIDDTGARTFNWNLERKTINPLKQLKSILELCNIIIQFKPDIVHAVAHKPVLYCGLLKRLGLDFSFVAALGGVGFIFTSNKLFARLLRPIISLLLRFCLNGKKTKFILQNTENIELFDNLKIMRAAKVKLVRGSGVEIDKFKPVGLPKGSPIIIFPARMLWDKGVEEFVSSAKFIKKMGMEAKFILVGDIDIHNSASVKQSQINEWVSKGIVEHWKRQLDMVKIYEKATIVCLPSYHEGLPKVLLEAAACARPVVAFDVAGSREIVIDHHNGFLVPFKSQEKLNNALIELLKSKSLCEKLGIAGRKLVEENFSDKIINQKIFKIWEEVK